MLVTIDEVLSPAECATAQALLAHSAWVSGQLTAGPQAAPVKNNQQLPENAEHLPALRALVLQALQHSALFLTTALPLKILPPLFNRYSGGTNAYGRHIDNAMRLLPGRDGEDDTSAELRPAYLRSDISATLFLSDPGDYEGGVLSIEDTFGTHGVKGQAGSLVLYPSSSVHAVTPVTRGQRLACFFFVQSMVRDAGQRRLLYDMDMALLRLRSQVGDNDALVQLTGTYHNLLRLWAET